MFPRAYRIVRHCHLLTLVAVFGASAGAQDFDNQLAKQGVAFLKTHCKRCHGDDERYPGLDVANLATLLRPEIPTEDPFLVPGDSGASRLWDVIDTEYMPPASQPQPSEQERDLFKQWIESGAHFPKEERPKRPVLGEETILQMIDNDLRTLPIAQRRYTRYFSLAHLWNDVSGREPTTDEDLRQVRAGLSKLVNSLSAKSRIVRPRVVDDQFATVFAIDMRDYGWRDWHWNEILKLYPYGLAFNTQTALNIFAATGTHTPYLRADWFLANASRPPLYHSLLYIPKNAKALEANLGVNIQRNFQRGELTRAAFKKSGVSQQNRMVERHDTTRGGRYYWKSYDVKPGTGVQGDFTRRPLGPVFDHVVGRQLAAFVHDGGEIIYGLPNGLQGYMLVDGQDRRIDDAPADVVFDPNSHSGSFVITNGISCMGCHKHGMISWKHDDIRPIFQRKLGQKVGDKVLQLFPPDDVMRGIVGADRSHFLRALEEATAVFLQEAEDKDKPIEQFPDPIAKVSNRYVLDVSVETAARELGFANIAELKLLARTRRFKQLGLAIWANEGQVSRETWEASFGSVANDLEIGTPNSVH